MFLFVGHPQDMNINNIKCKVIYFRKHNLTFPS